MSQKQSIFILKIMKTFLISTLIFLPVLVGMESAKAGYGYNPYKWHYDSWNRQYGANNSSWGSQQRRQWNPYAGAYKRYNNSVSSWGRW